MGGRNGRLLGVHAGRLLDVLRPHQQLALGDVVAFLHQDFGDLAHGIGVDVGLILLHGFDLTVGGNDLGQILPLDFAGLDRHHAPPAPHYSPNSQADEGHDAHDGERNFLPLLHSRSVTLPSWNRRRCVHPSGAIGFPQFQLFNFCHGGLLSLLGLAQTRQLLFSAEGCCCVPADWPLFGLGARLLTGSHCVYAV